MYAANAYFAGQDPGIDCTDDMFAEKRTHTTYIEARELQKNLPHPHGMSFSLGTERRSADHFAWEKVGEHYGKELQNIV